MAQDVYRSQFRLPHSLYEELKKAAERNHRSLNAELVSRLQSTFGDLRPYGELLNEGNTEEEARALQMRLSAMQEAMKALDQAADTLLGESQALSLEFHRVSRAAAAARDDKQKAGKND